MWNSGPPPPIHQQPPQHHFNNNTASLHSTHNPHYAAPPPQSQQPSSQAPHSALPVQHHQTSNSPSYRSKDLRSWCEAFDKHELVDILVKISQNNSQFQSYLGHAFVTDMKWCKIRVTFSAAANVRPQQHTKQAPNSTQIQQHFSQYGTIKRIECFPSINSALITYENYTFAQSAVSVGAHENVAMTGFNASCCYEFEGNEQPSMNALNTASSHSHSNPMAQSMQQSNNNSVNSMADTGMASMASGGTLEQRRIFVSSLSYSTSDDTLENVFSQYGELEDCTIVKDKLTGRSKGYGFVVFKSAGGAVNALKQPEKFIDGRRTRSWLAAQGNQFRNK